MLTTNEVRVMDLLARGGRWTVSDLRYQLQRARIGADAALARLPKLASRGLVAFEQRDGLGLYTATGDGIEECRRVHA